jgi:hypothetical protein
MGLLADRLKKAQQFGAKPFGYENPPVEMLMNLLGVPAVQQTMERMAYSEPLTTGRGMTTKPRAEAVEAAMAVAPVAGLLGKATKGLPVGASIKNVGKVDELTGLPLNSDGTVTVYHHTNKKAAEQIASTKKLKSAGEPDVYVTTEKEPNTGYGETVVPIRIDPQKLILDDEFPSGRMDFRISSGKSGVPIKLEPKQTTSPRQEALDTAQRNAALPIEEGGLGLPKDNTPEMRAEAMGYKTPVYHGTNEDINIFNVEGKGKTSGAGAFFTTNPTAAETYVSASGGGNILPLLLRQEDFLTANAKGRNWADIYTNQLGAKAGKKRYSLEDLELDRDSATSTDELGIIASNLGLKGAEIKNVKDLGPNSHVMRAKDYLYEKYGIIPDETWSNVTGKQFDEARKYQEKFYDSQKGDIYAIQDPSLVRSRFAAFDPMRRNEADILAGVLPLGLLADEEQRKKLYELVPSLLGQ